MSKIVYHSDNYRYFNWGKLGCYKHKLNLSPFFFNQTQMNLKKTDYNVTMGFLIFSHLFCAMVKANDSQWSFLFLLYCSFCIHRLFFFLSSYIFSFHIFFCLKFWLWYLFIVLDLLETIRWKNHKPVKSQPVETISWNWVELGSYI